MNASLTSDLPILPLQHRKYFSQLNIHYTAGWIIRFIIFCSNPSWYSDVTTTDRVRQLYTLHEQWPQQFPTHLHFSFLSYLVSKAANSQSPVCCTAALTTRLKSIWNIVIFLLLKIKILFFSKPGAWMTLYKALRFGLAVRTLCMCCYNLMKIYFQFGIRSFTWSLRVFVIKRCLCGNRHKAFLKCCIRKLVQRSLKYCKRKMYTWVTGVTD